MRIILIQFFVFVFFTNINAQTAVGDTIKIKTFKYGSNSRDSLIAFPTNTLTYEKIIMKYNMRCKNALISNQTLPNQGCGEWDYSCNTYIVDSTKVEKAPKTAPSHLISNFTGTNYVYTSQPLYDYYDFLQSTVTVNSITTETQYTIGTSNTAVPNLLKTNQVSGHSQILYTAAELAAAGLTAGNINGFILNVANAGGKANFFKVKMQQVSATSTVLAANSLSLTGFTQVYNSNFNFVTGDNRIQFSTPFVWNGTSNILIDFSFTNTVPTNPIIFNGTSSTPNLLLYSNNNYAAYLGAFGHAVINTASLTSISNELTVTMWAYGTPSLLPANTSVLYAWSNNQNERQLNIHFPWSDANVYFDAGFTSGNFDRINKVTTTNDIVGQWNHCW